MKEKKDKLLVVSSYVIVLFTTIVVFFDFPVEKATYGIVLGIWLYIIA